ncbi:MAG: DUF4340 domain-containing protein [Hyphomicrobiaceae bacterium]
MIKPQQFTTLAVAAAISAFAAIALYATTYRWSAGRLEGSPLVAGLERQEKAVAAVEVSQAGKRLTFVRQGDTWHVKEHDGYPANPERIRALLTSLAGAQLVERKTSKKALHAQLELEDPAAKTSKSRHVRVLDAKGGAIADIVVGKSRFNAFGADKGGFYVRRAGEDQTWLATGEPKATVDFTDWVSATLFELADTKIAKLTLTHPGEAPLVIERDAGDAKDAKAAAASAAVAKFRLASIPDGKKLKKDAAIEQIAQGFGSINLEDARKLGAPPAGDKVSVIKLEADGGLVVTFRLRADGEDRWLSFAATGSDGDAKKAAEAINAKANGWEFKILKWKAEQIGKHATDLLETS